MPPQRLGDTTAEYRWFAALYLLSAFFLLPVAVFLLSLAGLTAMYSVLGALAALFLLWGAVALLQNYRPGWLPRWLRNWHFLPLWMRSLKPLDDLITSTSCARSLLPIAIKVDEAEDEETKNLTGGSGGARPAADSAKFLAAGCCGAGGAAAVSAGSSPDGITTKDLEIGAVCKALEADAHIPAAASHCHGEEEAALLQKLTCGDAPIVKNSGPLEGRFVLRVVDDPV